MCRWANYSHHSRRDGAAEKSFDGFCDAYSVHKSGGGHHFRIEIENLRMERLFINRVKSAEMAHFHGKLTVYRRTKWAHLPQLFSFNFFLMDVQIANLSKRKESLRSLVHTEALVHLDVTSVHMLMEDVLEYWILKGKWPIDPVQLSSVHGNEDGFG